MAVGEMPAVGKIQPQDGVAGLQHRRIGFHVGLRSGVRLHVGVFSPKKLLGALPRQLFHHVGKLATAVVALSGIAFGVLVGEYRAHGFQHGFADEVLGGDQLQAFVLAQDFVVDGSGHLGIGFEERAGHGISFHDVVVILS